MPGDFPSQQPHKLKQFRAWRPHILHVHPCLLVVFEPTSATSTTGCWCITHFQLGHSFLSGRLSSFPNLGLTFGYMLTSLHGQQCPNTMYNGTSSVASAAAWPVTSLGCSNILTLSCGPSDAYFRPHVISLRRSGCNSRRGNPIQTQANEFHKYA